MKKEKGRSHIRIMNSLLRKDVVREETKISITVTILLYSWIFCQPLQEKGEKEPQIEAMKSTFGGKKLWRGEGEPKKN